MTGRTLMPGRTLALDAAAGTGTIAVLHDGELVAAREVAMRSDAEERYLPAILETLTEAGNTAADLARIACGAGPGSFTSLRVAGAMAKGLAEGLGIPLFAMPSLALIVASSEATRASASRWMATLDAMRGDRYLALVTVGDSGAITSVESLGLAPVAALGVRADAHDAVLIGPDEAVVGRPQASGLARLAQLVEDAGPVDLASWEPVYGRLAEAQVKWELAHGRSLDAARSTG
jgi:tRNA threonylcarbamoyladenosine biosynthesis protein TsaB